MCTSGHWVRQTEEEKEISGLDCCKWGLLPKLSRATSLLFRNYWVALLSREGARSLFSCQMGLVERGAFIRYGKFGVIGLVKTRNFVRGEPELILELLGSGQF